MLQFSGYTRAAHTSKGSETDSSLLSCRHWALMLCAAQHEALSWECGGHWAVVAREDGSRHRSDITISQNFLSRSGSLSPSRSSLWKPHLEMSGVVPFTPVWSTLPFVWQNSGEKSTGNQYFQIIPLSDNPFHFDEIGIEVSGVRCKVAQSLRELECRDVLIL